MEQTEKDKENGAGGEGEWRMEQEEMDTETGTDGEGALTWCEGKGHGEWSRGRRRSTHQVCELWQVVDELDVSAIATWPSAHCGHDSACAGGGTETGTGTKHRT